MKYFALLLGFCLFACSSKQVASNNVFIDIPQPPSVRHSESRRQLASDEEYLGSSYNSFYGNRNYIERLQQTGKLVRLLQSIMEEKGHPRKRLLEKFKDDLDKEIVFLLKQEDAIGKPLNLQALPKTWLPQANSLQYGAKLRSLQAVLSSSEVMARLESYLSATKVMEDGNYEQNFYYGLLRKALAQLNDELKKVDGNKVIDLFHAQSSYGDFLASVARSHLHHIFRDKSSRPVEKRLKQTFRQIQRVRTPEDAKTIMASAEVTYASSVLLSADYSGSSDIEGSRDDMDTKMATYFSLEMIKYLYGNLN